ncbi:uncharacterized protein K441DRAFT_69684 [Cenococcum geophilum 1.58]|uniref:uncharacterized protein n=1 Tax=Cenococcum geophilum 1.58 TaxID=794803 RepID=UPI00358E1000|nr:hypothetical protein K441DRAFT_69684 [Cenococcum geophilum 1.58]
MAALECLRNIGAEEECVHAATKGDCMQHTRWCRSTAGEEFARIYSWGNDPARQGDYDAASPCKLSSIEWEICIGSCNQTRTIRILGEQQLFGWSNRRRGTLNLIKDFCFLFYSRRSLLEVT